MEAHGEAFSGMEGALAELKAGGEGLSRLTA